MNNIDINNDTEALQIKGTVKAGSYTGASGYAYDGNHLKTTGSDEHEHTFVEYPGCSCSDKVYHGASSPKSNVTVFGQIIFMAQIQGKAHTIF